MIARAAVAAILGAMALVLAGCGEKTDVLTQRASLAQPLSVMLDGAPDANVVGLYQGLADGEFKRAGIALNVRLPGPGITPLQELNAGRVDVAIAREPELIQARDRGEPLVAIAAIVQSPLDSIVSIAPNRITTPSELRGQRVGDSGQSYERAYLSTILTQAGIPPADVREREVADPTQALVAGKIDAALGSSWNIDAVHLAQRRHRPAVIRLEDAGVPDYDEFVFVTRESLLASRNTDLRLFVQATGRGYAAVHADPEAGIDSLLKANPALSPRLARASVAATLPAFFPPGGTHPWGWQNQTQWYAYGKWMLEQHLIGSAGSVVGASTNQLLAGQGP